MSVPTIIADSVDNVMRQFKKRMETYLSTFKDPRLTQYFNAYTLAEPEKFKTIVQYPVQNNKFVDVPYEMKASIKSELRLINLHFTKAEVSFEFPTYILGPNGVVPQIIYKIKSPISYPGNVGLVWEGLSGDPRKWKFHPFGSKLSMKNDLMTYYQDGTIDQLCEILNNPEEKSLNALRIFLREMTDGKITKNFKFEADIMAQKNYIQVPISIEFNEKEHASYIYTRTWAYGNEWITPSLVILNVFEALCNVITRFDENAELKPVSDTNKKDDTQAGILNQDRRVLLDPKMKIKDREKGDIFSQQSKKVDRDEFGYIIGEKKGFSSKDVQISRNTVLNMEKKLELEKNTKNVSQDLSHVQKFQTAQIWYDTKQGNQFVLKGETKNLPFKDKVITDILKTMSSPFILKYARDQVRLKMQCTSQKAIEFLFVIYNQGFLFEA
jgi:hypothetical protein